MKIIDLVVNRYVERADSDMAYGQGNEVVVVEVHTDQDVTGRGFLSTPLFSHGDTGDLAVTLLRRNLKNIIIGENPLYTERLWQQMFTGPWRLGMRGMIRDCIAAIDFALWDIKGKLLNVPVSDLLGDRRERILTYANVGHQLSPDKLAEKTAEYVKFGHTAVKIRGGANAVSLEESTKRVAAVREAIGPDVKLMVDVNGTWDVATAIAQLREWEPYNVYWLEEPVAPENIIGYASVKAHAGDTFIVGGEQNGGLHEFRQFIEEEAVDMIQPNAMCTGGITDWLKIYNYATGYNIPVSPWNLHQIHVHLAIGLPNVKWVEYFTPDRQYFQNVLLKGPELQEEIDEGGIYLKAPTTPGLGIVLDEKIAEESIVKD